MRQSQAPAATRAFYRRQQRHRAPVKRRRETDNADSIADVLIFCGIGFALMVLESIFQLLKLPPPQS
jgi:hypothetical protein